MNYIEFNDDNYEVEYNEDDALNDKSEQINELFQKKENHENGGCGVINSSKKCNNRVVRENIDYSNKSNFIFQKSGE